MAQKEKTVQPSKEERAQTEPYQTTTALVADKIEEVIRANNPPTEPPPTDTAPVFTLQPVGATVDEGAPITLAVTASGAETYQWQKEDNDIAGATAATYEKPIAEAADAGLYHCVAANSVGEVCSDEVTITVTPIGGARSSDDERKKKK